MHVVLRIDPGNAAANTNLATFLRLTGDVAAGEVILQRVIDAHPDAVAARINMAANLRHEDRAGEAFALLAGPPCRPGWRHRSNGAFSRHLR
jgi:thioredoxin-like negative regulator of GroEL